MRISTNKRHVVDHADAVLVDEKSMKRQFFAVAKRLLIAACARVFFFVRRHRGRLGVQATDDCEDRSGM